MDGLTEGQEAFADVQLAVEQMRETASMWRSRFEETVQTGFATVNQTLEDVATEVGEMQDTMDQHGVDISKLETTKDELQTKVKLHCTVLKQKC